MMTRTTFGEAYQEGHGRTLHFLLSKGFPEHVAEETAQAAWARGWERRRQLRSQQSTIPWVNSIALNMVRTRLRRDNRLDEYEDRPVPPGNLDAAIDVERMLDRCPERYRGLLERRYLRGWDIRELAEEDGCTRRAIRVRLFRARKHLRERFGDEPAERPVQAGSDR